MPNVLQIITKSELGGAQSHVADLLDGLRGGDTELHLAAGVEGPLTARARALGVAVHLLPLLQHAIHPSRDVAAVRECAALIRRIKPDLVHAHSSKAGMVARLAGKRTGIPVVFTVHGWGFNPGPSRPARGLAWAVEWMLAKGGGRIICVSEHSRQSALASRIGNARQLVTIRNGIAPDAPLAHPESDPPRLVMVARFAKPKDYATLLHAAAWLQNQDAPPFRLALIGSGPQMEEMRALARSLNFGEEVSFEGDRGDVPQILADAQGFILSSYSEGLPLSIMEAMRAGLPIIATNVGGIPEEVEAGVNGWLVPPHNAPALGAAMRELLESPARRAEVGRASRRKFEREFTRDRMLRQIEALYREVLAKPRL